MITRFLVCVFYFFVFMLRESVSNSDRPSDRETDTNTDRERQPQTHRDRVSKKERGD